jgi:hypothetical protein
LNELEGLQRPPRFVHGLFCEQVRDEVGGTQTYVGVYGPVLTLPFSPPVAIATLAAVVWVAGPADEQLEELSIRLHTPDGSTLEVMRNAPPPSFPDMTSQSVRRVAQVVLRVNNLAIHRVGAVWLEVIVGGANWLAASLNVQVAAPSVDQPS